MLPGSAEDHYTHVIRGIDPIEDIDDFRPERGIHRIDLLGSVDHDSGNLVCQLYAEGFVFGHAIILDSKRMGTS